MRICGLEFIDSLPTYSQGSMPSSNTLNREAQNFTLDILLACPGFKASFLLGLPWLE